MSESRAKRAARIKLPKIKAVIKVGAEPVVKIKNGYPYAQVACYGHFNKDNFPVMFTVVLFGDDAEEAETLKVGDKIKVKGKFVLIDNKYEQKTAVIEMKSPKWKRV